MGSGSSGPAVGVTANPRVVYNEKLSKKENKASVMDCPVLVDVQHGTIRYRCGTYDGEPADKTKRIERPFEGKDTNFKQHYFYHARLNDFSQGADPSKEDAYKFMYVTKGPARVNQKKLFYVYGRGMEAKDGTRVRPTQTKEEGNDYSWPGLRVPNHLYYKLTFTDELSVGDSGDPVDEEDRTIAGLQSTPDKSCIRLTLTAEERARDVKGKIAVKILKAASDIHICYGNLELRDEDVVGEYRDEAKRGSSNMGVDVRFI
ncbi:uncharacterized protein LOC124292521 isoform X1 [Haliotis rubra]|uniref:uncharacterized protein LOC124292521 isoform X1 n=1 Tax=Haliotis rubra TaxID=36100 RepID=UPI001EE62210|nr:uncharacterized protein LOC124292521 isoform X1 [Haliotis rubra]